MYMIFIVRVQNNNFLYRICISVTNVRELCGLAILTKFFTAIYKRFSGLYNTDLNRLHIM